MNALAAEVESFLRRRQTWVSTQELCLLFHVEPRELRATGEKSGLCSDFAISGPQGYRHVNACTAAEWLSFSERLHSHGLAELRRAATLRLKREGAPVDRMSPQPELI